MPHSFSPGLIYDRLPYDGDFYPETYPFRIHAVARLFSIPSPTSVKRVLEIGCAEGTNLIPVAFYHPDVECHGFDISKGHIQRGKETIERLSLKNIHLSVADINSVALPSQPFDVIIVHGVYSWVDTATRKNLLSLIARHLAADGLAYVSFNVYPGWRLREGMRDILEYGAGGFGPDAEHTFRGLSFAREVISSFSEKSALGNFLRTYFEKALRERANYIAHDYLSPWNTPFSFRDFAADLSPFGLFHRFEAIHSGNSGIFLSDAAKKLLPDQGLEPHRFEEMMDILSFRSFRRSIISKHGPVSRRTIDNRALEKLWFLTPYQTTSDGVRYTSVTGLTIQARSEASQATLELLSAHRGLPLSFQKLSATWDAWRGGEGHAPFLVELLNRDLVFLTTGALERRPSSSKRLNALASFYAKKGYLVTPEGDLVPHRSPAPERLGDLGVLE